MKRVGWVIAVLAVLGLGGLAYQHYWPIAKGSAQVAANRVRPPGVPVIATQVAQKAMPVEIDAIGTVQPIASVAVRSRVDSQISAVHFNEGDAVHEGDPLFTLDSRAVAAQLRQAQANLAKDQATLQNAKRDVERYRQLVAKDYVSRQQFDTAQATADSLVATIDADQAMIDNLSTQLTYYEIKAPIGGRTGAISAKIGNLIRATDSAALTTINQISPIYVSFSVPQRLVDELRAAMKAGPVKVRVAAQGESPVEGFVAFIDNSIDVQSGTIAVRATIPNDDETLWPGEFVSVTTILRVEPDAVVVPAPAVQIGQNGTYVFVIKPDQTVDVRPVTVERSQGGESIIAKGLAKDERIVVDGQLRLTVGSRIEERPAVATSRPDEGV
jgi:membrane fusion protein, multidrug efflux system